MKINNAVLKMILVTAGAVIFNIVFWQEKLALNAIFFDAFVLLSVFYLYPAAFTKTGMKWLLAAHAVAIATVIVHNTLLSKLAFSATLLLVVVFTQYLHRSVWYAAASVVSNYVLLIFSALEEIQHLKLLKIKSVGLRKMLRFIIIPVIIGGIFLIVYALANTVFQTALSKVAVAVEHFVMQIFSQLQWQRFGFLLLGFAVTGGMLLKAAHNYFSNKDVAQHNDLYRQKNNLRRWKKTALFDLLTLFMGRFANGVLALRNENTVGIISLVLLNILLLIINAIDVVYVWFGFTYTPDVNLKDIVHEGTGLLIFSIVLAVAVVLFFFRGNLNFYKKNKWLRYGAYGWIFQNAILLISVLLRDWYYIQHQGLAYKRIGLLAFLTMVLMGLITVFIKIHYKKTAYYLWRVNGWFAILLLVISSCINWDETIAGYNLAKKNTIPVDVIFLLTLNDKVLPLLQAHPDLLDKPIANNNADYPRSSELSPRMFFLERRRQFMAAQQQYTWLSWNVADADVKKQFKKTNLLSTINK